MIKKLTLLLTLPLFCTLLIPLEFAHGDSHEEVSKETLEYAKKLQEQLESVEEMKKKFAFLLPIFEKLHKVSRSAEVMEAAQDIMKSPYHKRLAISQLVVLVLYMFLKAWAVGKQKTLIRKVGLYFVFFFSYVFISSFLVPYKNYGESYKVILKAFYDVLVG